MRSVLHPKNTYLSPTLSLNSCSYTTQEPIPTSNKENCPVHLYSESTTEDYYSKENSDFEDLEDSLCNKQLKIKIDRKFNEDFQRKTVIDETKYKTEMCKNWEERGRCNYGKKCKFAHGKHELVDKSLINKDRYKSKLCNSFHSLYYCPYGQRCLFIHAQSKNIDNILNATYFRRFMNLISFENLLEEESVSKRCEVFEKMSNENQRSLDIINENFCRNLVDE